MQGREAKRWCWAMLVFGLAMPTYASDYGAYIGRVVAQWLPDGRTMKLIESFAYEDPKKIRWEAPAGSVVDGASIPQIAWSIVGGPFEGKYRVASVIHDVACKDRQRSWQQVHWAFYMAMLASGEDTIRAKVMYAAVYHNGPRWERTVNIQEISYLDIGQKIEAISSLAQKGEHLSTSVSTYPKGAGALPFFGAKPKTADITVRFVPDDQNRLSEKQFEVLKAEIEVKDLSLTEIEDYLPLEPPAQ
ncbi:DUF1353 domain-containing protein [Chitinimonas sp. PSY-7]